MAATTTTTPSSNNPTSPSSSPRSVPLTRTESPPWTQIVRGQESESTSSPKMTLEENSENVGGGKKPVWNKKPTNGPVENGGGPGPVVMGPAEAWPALSESTSKASPKVASSSIDFGSVSSPQVIASELSTSITSSIPLQSPTSSTYQKPTTSNLNHNPHNHGRPVRQKSMKRDPQSNGGFSHQPSEGSHNHNSANSTTSGDSTQNHGHRDSGSRNASGDHHQPRNSFRRGGGGGSHSREGSHQNYAGRRNDQDRGNHDWNHQRSFNGRDATMQPRVSPRGFRPMAVSAPFAHPPPMRPAFMNPMGVAEVPVYYLPAVPFVAPVPGPMFIHPAPDPQLHAKIVNQIDYYFSKENLSKDTYLRRNMDEHGWVPVTLIAGFKRVVQLTDNIQLILDAVRSSTVVEVQGDKIRKRDDWESWLLSPSIQIPTTSSLQSPKSPTIDTLSANFQNFKVDEKAINQNHITGELNVNIAPISKSKDLNSPSQGGSNSSGY